HERYEQYRRAQRPAPRAARLTRAEAALQPLHHGREAHAYPNPPGGERRDKEVVALAHFVLEPRCTVGLGEAPFEVEIEDERHGQRGDQGRHRQRGPPVGAPLPPSASEPERPEPHSQQALRARGPIAAELPREVLYVVQELLAVEHERVAG